ncbi:histidinol dehydrogenase [Sinomonas cellulolyticus]|uniref:Histidinol dehydrogenase n=1 Tax=Sinomonas cellulolyticus TaxID=2801916 RepID=A0ABS1K3J9_9MICC|nr:MULTISPECIES: histidinol dehydrogenase [Sinomonas]MBL0706266.1 histidinol dehydrogenase [Sinomonas cellulolyticus]GHG61143.1 histidinol dehydrogenase [Sinomonas sp. KCTC 49339]
MQINEADKAYINGKFTTLKEPEVGGVPAQRLPEVIETVSSMLSDIEKNGIDAVIKYSQKLDKWEGKDLEVSREELARTGDSLSPQLREALAAGAERTRLFAVEQREHLTDFETEILPGVFAGQKYIPVPRVGAYLPAGRFPILASAFMSVNVAKAAGVPTAIACTPPTSPTAGHPAVLHAAYLSGVDRAFVVGGVQGLAAMAFGLLGEAPVDILVGAGNAYVTEAKRQLFGRVGIDLLAGPSEVAAIADDTADPEIVAADLLGQAEHGPQSPASLVTTSRAFGEAVIRHIEKQLETLATRHIAGPAWRDFGTVYVAEDRETAVELMDTLAPEHLEIQTEDDAWYHENLNNYGSIFLGPWSTVAYSDKGISGTNHTLPTGRGARSSAGLSVSRFLKPLTYQRVEKEATPRLATYVAAISEFEGMEAHRATATLRLDAYNR